MKLLFTDKQFMNPIKHPTIMKMEQALNQEDTKGITWKVVNPTSTLIKNINRVDWVRVHERNHLILTIVGFKEEQLLAVVKVAIDLTDPFSWYGADTAVLIGQYLTGYQVVDVTGIVVNPEYRGQGIARSIIKAIWKKDIPLTIMPANGLETLFKDEVKFQPPAFRLPMYSTVMHLFDIYLTAPVSPQTRLTAFQMIELDYKNMDNPKPVLYLKSFILDELLLVKVPGGYFNYENVLPLQFNQELQEYVYEAPNYKNDQVVLMPLEQLLNHVGCYSGLVRLDEGMGAEDPYTVLDMSQYKLFRRINAAQAKRLALNPNIQDNILNSTYDPLETSIEFHARFIKYYKEWGGLKEDDFIERLAHDTTPDKV